MEAAQLPVESARHEVPPPLHIRLYDNPTNFYRKFVKRFFNNVYESLSFYDFLARLSDKPMLVWTKGVLDWYTRKLHAAALPLPMAQVIDLIEQAKVIAVDDCICRNLWPNCDREKRTCFKINTAAEAYAEGHENSRVSREEAIAIIKKTREQGMITQIETCMAPYNFSICCCCSCCCLAYRLRYKHGVYNGMRSGYFIPEFDRDRCTECGACADVCPPKALTNGGQPMLDLDACLGCGLCAEHCPSNGITMVSKRTVNRIEERPPLFEWLALWAFVLGVMVPGVTVYSWFTGRKTRKFGKLAQG
jgi:Pyruvate/2-oxoacid:ferredoxin oxidoreductase delta subunit